MKSIKFYPVIAGLFFLLITSACSEQETSLAAPSTLERTLPPPMPGELRGLYDLTFSNGAQANLLFEYGNYVNFGDPQLHNRTTEPGYRTTYSVTSGGVYQFTLVKSGVNLNYSFTYNTTTATLTGRYGTGTSYTNRGGFTAKKHITGTSGQDYIKGYWLGTYNGTNDYLMVFEENGKVTVGTGATYFGSTIATGTYQLVNSVLTGTYTYPSGDTYSFITQVNYNSQTINGTWGMGTNNFNGGNFSLSAMNFY